LPSLFLNHIADFSYSPQKLELCISFFYAIKLLKINEFTKQIGDYFSHRFPFSSPFFQTPLIPNSRSEYEKRAAP